MIISKNIFIGLALVLSGCGPDEGEFEEKVIEEKSWSGIVIYDYAPGGENLIRINGEPVSLLLGKGSPFTFSTFPVMGKGDSLEAEFSPGGSNISSLYIESLDRSGAAVADKFRKYETVKVELPEFGDIKKPFANAGKILESDGEKLKDHTIRTLGCLAARNREGLSDLFELKKSHVQPLIVDLALFDRKDRAIEFIAEQKDLEVEIGSACALVFASVVDGNTERRSLIRSASDKNCFAIASFLFAKDEAGGLWLHGPSGWAKFR